MPPRGRKGKYVVESRAVLPAPLEEFVVGPLITNHDLSVLANVMMMHLSCRSVALFFVSATRDVFARTTDHAALSFDLALTFPVAAPPWARDAFA